MDVPGTWWAVVGLSYLIIVVHIIDCSIVCRYAMYQEEVIPIAPNPYVEAPVLTPIRASVNVTSDLSDSY